MTTNKLRRHLSYVSLNLEGDCYLFLISFLAIPLGFHNKQNPDCVLCPRGRNEDRKKKPYPPADSFLRICKQTEQQSWAHVLCAAFSQEITFADATRLRLVEGINTISNHRWSAVSWDFISLTIKHVDDDNVLAPLLDGGD